jgi:enoyl-CoA hydratase/carnithine racemase
MSIRTDRHDSIVVLNFDRPERKNAITAAMYTQLADGLAQAAQDASVRVVIIAGTEQAFTAGNDLGDFLNNPPSDAESPVWRFLGGIATFPKPLLAAVCGPAVGVGTTLLLHCDQVYAGDNAQFSMPFASLGLCPEAASSLLLPMIVGYQRAAEKLLFGEPFGAAEALQMGIVSKIMPAAQVNEFALARAQLLAAKPASALAATKALMKRPLADSIATAMRAEGDQFGKLLAGPAAREAFSAFMAKRKPDFSKV